MLFFQPHWKPTPPFAPAHGISLLGLPRSSLQYSSFSTLIFPKTPSLRHETASNTPNLFGLVINEFNFRETVTNEIITSFITVLRVFVKTYFLVGLLHRRHYIMIDGFIAFIAERLSNWFFTTATSLSTPLFHPSYFWISRIWPSNIAPFWFSCSFIIKSTNNSRVPLLILFRTTRPRFYLLVLVGYHSHSGLHLNLEVPHQYYVYYLPLLCHDDSVA